MSTYSRRVFNVLAAAGLSRPSFALTSKAGPEMWLAIQRALTEHYARISVGYAPQEVRASLTGEGRWKDIDYSDTAVARWQPLEHLRRVRAMALAGAQIRPGTVQRSAWMAAIERGLAYWQSRRPQSGNWWYNTIGAPNELGAILVLCGSDLSEDLRQSAARLLVSADQVPKEQATAQNLVWYARNQFIRGFVTRNLDDVEVAARQLVSQVAFTSSEGLQVDYSFHQHGAQLYSGGYGLNFLVDTLDFASWLADTPWALGVRESDLLIDYALRGVLPLCWKGWMDWAAQGREFTRAVKLSKVDILSACIKRLQTLRPDRRTELQNAIDELAGDRAASTGVYRFWRSDVVVSRSADLYVSVKSCSARTVGTECGNGENLKGFWIPFGMNCLMRSGNEYQDLPFVWNWARLPGVTSTNEVPEFTGYLSQAETFVGSCQLGKLAVATQHVNKNGLHARKSWFLLEGRMVALGADIRHDEHQPFWTTLNQTRHAGDLFLAQAGKGVFKADPSGRWEHVDAVWHRGLSYEALDEQGLEVEVGTRSPTAIINRELGQSSATLPVLLITRAGTKGSSPDGYAYTVSAADEPMRLPTNTGRDIKVVKNQPGLQMITVGRAQGVVMAVLHEPGELALERDTVISAASPGILIASRGAAGWSVVWCDPTRTQTSLQYEVQRLGATSSPVTRKERRNLALSADGQGRFSI